MKKRFLSLLLSVLLLSILLPGAQAISFSNYALTLNDDTVLVSTASATGQVVGLLPAATLLEVLGQSMTGKVLWYHVSWSGTTGYVSAANVRLLTTDEANEMAGTGGSDTQAGGGATQIGGSSPLRGYSYQTGYQYVQFGSYAYQRRGGEAPILWRVLTVDGGYALLWSEYIVDCRPYLEAPYDNAPTKGCAFTDSAVYSFLNGEFVYRAFDDTERGALVGTSRGLAFVLDQSDLTNPGYGFQSNSKSPDPNRSAYATPYAAACGCFVAKEGGGSNYWVSTVTQGYIVNMHYNGSMGKANVYRTNIGVRVAVWVDVSLCTLSGGDGSLNNPYQFGGSNG